MAVATLTGSAGAARALDPPVVVSLSSISLSDFRVDSVVAKAWMSTNAYATTYQVRARLLDSGSNTLGEVTRTDIKFTSGDYTGKTWTFNFGTAIDVNAIRSIQFYGLNSPDKIFVKDTQSVDVTYTSISACAAPTTAAATPSLCENDPNLAASGAAGGIANSIVGYEIQYTESADGTAWGAWTALKTYTTGNTYMETTVTKPSQHGYHRKYRVRTMGAAGEPFYSGWKETNSVKRNSPPTEPTDVTATPEIYESGGITVSWTAATDPDGNLSRYRIATLIYDQQEEQWEVQPGTEYTQNTSIVMYPELERGEYVAFAVCAIDVFDAMSNWAYSDDVKRNQAPFMPILGAPSVGKTTYNPRPRLLITLDSDPEGHDMAAQAAGYTVSSIGVHAAGKKLVLRKTVAASAGTISVAIKAVDEMGAESAAVNRDLTYTEPEFTDPDLEAGTTHIKAAHVNELRVMVNNARQYYGLPAKVWQETITAGETSVRNWREHITELRAAINEIVALVNDWDSQSTVNRIPSPAWVGLSSKPSAAVMSQLRAVIESL